MFNNFAVFVFVDGHKFFLLSASRSPLSTTTTTTTAATTNLFSLPRPSPFPFVAYPVTPPRLTLLPFPFFVRITTLHLTSVMEEDGIRQIASALDAVYSSSSNNQARSEASAVSLTTLARRSSVH